MNKKISLLLFLIFFSLIISFRLNFFKIWTDCEFYKLYNTTLLNLGSLTIIGIIGLIYSYLLKVKYKFIYYGFFPILAALIIGSFYNKKLNEDIQNNKCIITKGIVKEKIRYKLGGEITVCYYLNNSSRVTEVFSFKNKSYSKLKINDTILVQYAENCYYITKIFTVHPRLA